MMKTMKKLMAIVMVAAMIMAMAVTVSAAETGTITITSQQTGQTYNIYRMFDWAETETTGKYWYKINTDWEAFNTGETYFDLDENGFLVKMNKTETEIATAAKTYAEGLTDATYSNVGATVENAPYGYYLMVSSFGNKVALGTLKDSTGLTLREKNTEDDLPAIKKTYADGTTSGSYSIGDTAEFQVVITAHEGGKEFTVHDQATDLANFTDFSFTVTTSTGAVLTTSEVDNAPGDGCTFHVNLVLDKSLHAHDTITIKYKATVTGTNPVNKATLSTPPGEDNPGTSSLTYGFTLKKTDTAGNSLNGATFVLYRVVDGNNKYATFDADGKLTGWVDTVDTATKLEVGSKDISGLAAGTYYLTETDAPSGYKALTADIQVTITEIKEDGVATGKSEISASGAAVDVANNEKVDGTKNTLAVKNEALDALPETGGIGTTLFYVVGGMMAVGALVLLVTKKRMAA